MVPWNSPLTSIYQGGAALPSPGGHNPIVECAASILPRSSTTPCRPVTGRSPDSHHPAQGHRVVGYQRTKNGKGSAAVTSGAPSSRTRYVRRPRPSFDCVGRRRLHIGMSEPRNALLGLRLPPHNRRGRYRQRTRFAEVPASASTFPRAKRHRRPG
jgi:hypothetical protein